MPKELVMTSTSWQFTLTLVLIWQIRWTGKQEMLETFHEVNISRKGGKF